MDSLERFVRAQDQPPLGTDGLATALDELRDGCKRGHWIWWIFPQLRGLGSSDLSVTYGLESLEEAQAYLAHPVLGARLHECARLLLEAPPRSADAILGAIDALKAQASMTIFMRAAPDDQVFRQVLEHHYHGLAHHRTEEMLAAD